MDFKTYERFNNTKRLQDNLATKLMRPSDEWMRRAFKSAFEARSWSKDPNRQVGAVVMTQEKKMYQGFNGFPKWIEDAPELLNDRDTKRSLMLHAEHNALDCKGDANDCIIFVTAPTCHQCAMQIISRGVIAVHCISTEFSGYEESFKMAQRAYALAGVLYQEHTLEELGLTL